MYSYEKKSLHCRVMSNDLEKAAKIAERISGYHDASYFPTERYERDKKHLLDLLSKIAKDAETI